MNTEQQRDFFVNWMLNPVPFEPCQKLSDPVRTQAAAIGNMMAQAVLLYPDQVRQGEYGLELTKNLPNGSLKLDAVSIAPSFDHAKGDSLELSFTARGDDACYAGTIYEANRYYTRDGVGIFAETHRSGAVYGVPRMVEQAFQPLFKRTSRQTLVQRIADERLARGINTKSYQPVVVGYKVEAGREHESVAAALLSKHELSHHGAGSMPRQMGFGIAMAAATVLFGKKSERPSAGFVLHSGQGHEWRLDMPESNGQLVVSASIPRGWYDAPERDLIALSFQALGSQKEQQLSQLFVMNRVYDPAQTGVVLASEYKAPRHDDRKLPAALYNQLAQQGLQKQLRREIKAIRAASALLK